MARFLLIIYVFFKQKLGEKKEVNSIQWLLHQIFGVFF